MSKDKDILGRGLKSLIPEEIESGLKTKENVIYLGVDKIEVDEHQPRKTIDSGKISELAQSIREHGILQPLIVTKKGDGSYHLVAGQRRLNAAREAGLAKVPVIVKEADAEKKLEMSLIENIQREDLDPIEEAEAYNILFKKFKLKYGEIAQKVGKAEVTVTNSVRLLELPQEVKDAVKQNLITYGHARAMITMPKSDQLKLLPEIINKKLTVRDIEARCKRHHEVKKSSSYQKSSDAEIYLKNISGEIRDILQTKVTIQDKGKAGRIFIDYYSKEELERILDLFRKIKNYIEGEK